MKKPNKTPLAIALGSTLLSGLTLTSSSTQAESLSNVDANPFTITELSNGYMQTAESDDDKKGTEGKCGEGKCGGDMVKGSEEKTAEGKCAGNKPMPKKEKSTEGKCGEGKCGENKPTPKKEKSTEGKCGEGKCGGSM